MAPISENSISIVALQYELSLLIGIEPRLVPMLRRFFPRALKLLGVRAAHVWLRNKNTQLFEHRYAYPSRDRDLVLNNPEADAIRLQFERNRQAPAAHTLADGSQFLLFPLNDLGYCALIKVGSTLTDPVMVALNPIFSRLAVACGASMNFEEVEYLRLIAARNEIRVRSVLESLPAGVIVVNAETRQIDFANPHICGMLGYHPEEMVGLTFTDIHPDDLSAQVAKEYERILHGEQQVTLDIPVKRKDGSTFPAELNLASAAIEGQPSMFCVFSDITERKAADRAKDEFISTVSHELRTPLTAINGALGLLGGGVLGPLSRQARGIVSVALQNSERLGALINDLLDVERLMEGKLSITLRAESLPNLLEQILENNQSFARRFQVQLALTERPVQCWVKIDAQRLTQVLTNLIANAVKFSPRGGRVEVRADCQNNLARIEILDFGSGIPSTFHDRIFQKFAQADASDTRSKGGTGLGLAIAKDLTERMGGRIGYRTEMGRGSTFYVEFPLVDSDEVDAVTEESGGGPS